MVRITANEKSLLFTFTNSNHYFQNGTVEVPKNSLALIVDDSDMASFKKSASNDLFISASYTELGMTKEELISWFEENGFSEGGSSGGLTPEEAQTMIDSSISGKADTTAVTAEISASVSGKADTSAMTTALADKTDVSAFTSYSASVDTALSNKADVSSLTAYFDGAEYNSTGKTIEFYNNGVLKDSIDATAFIKDGMVDTVSIEDITSGGTTVNCLVITFNTDSGKENINIPIKDIFDSDLYYTKTATDTLLDAKLNVSDFNTYSGGVNSTITSIQGNITDVQTSLNGKANASDLQALEVVVGTKANATDLDSLANTVNGKVDVSAYTAYTSSTETTINGKASQTDLETVSGNVSTLSGQVADKVDLTAYTAYTAATETTINGKASQTDLETVSGNVDTISGDMANKVDVSTYTAYTSATDTTLQGKADASDLANYVETSAYTAYTSATETALNGKQNTLTAGTNISISNDVISVTGITNQTVTSVTQAEYDSLTTKDPDTFYIISDATGGTITIDPSLDSGSTNAVANSAITTAINAISGNVDTLSGAVANKVDTSAYTSYTSATNTAIAAKASQTDLNTVSAATASNTTALGGYKLWKGTTAEYEAIVTKDEDTIYFIVNNS